MKKLTEYIAEGLVTEKLANSFIAMFLKHIGKSNILAHSYNWDAIPADSYHLFTADEALKLYRKSAANGGLSDSLVIWFNKNYKYDGDVDTENVLNDASNLVKYFNFASYGTWIEWSNYLYRRGRDTVRSLGMESQFAVAIDNIADYSTSDLKRTRSEAKRDAVALKSAAQVAEENIKRYKTAIAEKNTPDLERLADELEKANAAYTGLLKQYNDKILDLARQAGLKNVPYDIYQLCTKIKNKIEKINNIYRDITDAFNTILYGDSTGQLHGGTGYWNAQYYKEKADKIIDLTAKLKEMLEEFAEQEAAE